PTHPDQNAWYDSADPRFTWTLPDGALAVRTVISDKADAKPAVLYKPAISEKEVTGLADGTSYFSVQAETAAGWGSVSTYRVNIDTTPPSLGTLAISYDADAKGVEISGKAEDALSGIDHYVLTIDAGAPVSV